MDLRLNDKTARVTASIDDYARWLSRVTLAVAITMIGWDPLQ